MEKFLTILSFIVIVGGCSRDFNEQLPNPYPVSSEFIKSVAIQERTVSFIVVCMIPEPCWDYVRTDRSASGQFITFTVFARRHNNDAYLQVLSSIEAPATISVPSAGTYTF